jgi:hypothetical protein
LFLKSGLRWRILNKRVWIGSFSGALGRKMVGSFAAYNVPRARISHEKGSSGRNGAEILPLPTTEGSDQQKSTLVATSPNGSVKIENDHGRLRIRFTHLGKRYCFALGLPDSKVNRTAAIGKATQIELDLASGHPDPTLKAYKPQRERQAEGIELISMNYS